ncbi:MAG: glycosyltransferase family 2 protein [Comamonadaceae bacterium]|nr:glycosyltransferase family 2 protein [Comamonadaceae bacterium]
MGDIMTPIVVALEIVIFVYFMVLNVLYTLFTVVSLKDIRRYTSTVTDLTVKSILGGAFYKPLSVIVPAYNEEETIVASVNALLNLQYPEFEVIVVNDGSKDKTMDALMGAFRLVRADKPIRRILDYNQVRGRQMSLDHHNLIVIDKKNGGKADALNAGMNASSFPLFCCIDADSLLESEASCGRPASLSRTVK